MKPLPRSFFLNETTQVAESLLGSYLVREVGGEKLIGKIVETEAYLGLKDPCCHSFTGSKTPRTRIMYLPGGHSYVYFTYGMHYCFNVVTGGEDKPEAVLIRALEPVQGVSQMKKNRNKSEKGELCSGPAKLCQALGITKDLNARDLTRGDFYISKGRRLGEVETDSRVGLPLYKDSAYWFLRFYIKNNPFVSLRENQIH